MRVLSVAKEKSYKSDKRSFCAGRKRFARMATLNVFVSFEFDKDDDLKNNFYEQAKDQTNLRIRNCSLNEAYPIRSDPDFVAVS